METILLLLISAIIFYYLLRLLFPWLLRLLARRMMGNLTGDPNQTNDTKQKTARKQSRAPHHDKKVGKNIGEYVEYEEIKG